MKLGKNRYVQKYWTYVGFEAHNLQRTYVHWLGRFIRRCCCHSVNNASTINKDVKEER